MKIGRRQEKRYLQKKRIVDTMINHMKVESFNSINIEVLCKEVGLSKVTFFSYFQTKEEVIEYFIHMWQYDLAYELKVNNIKGLEGLNYIFNGISSNDAGQEIMNVLIEYILKTDNSHIIEIEDYEWQLHNKSAYDAGFKPINILELIDFVICDSIEDEKKREQFVKLLLTGFYGVPIYVKCCGKHGLKDSYDEYVSYHWKQVL